jgi:chromosome segregation ATPase
MEPIIFDTATGISREEQEDILASLDTLNHLESGEAGIPLEKKAEKKGALLPLLVNGIAVVLLLGGLSALFLAHKQEEARFTLGEVSPGITERKLIEEIRRETSDKLSAKDAEIAEILAKIAGIDVEIEDVLLQFDKNTILENEKDKTLTDLQKQKDEYQARLTALQKERGQLLEVARAREAALRSQRETSRAITEQVQSVQSELTSVQEQMWKLTEENEKNALIDRQLDGYFASVNAQIESGLFAEASSTLSAMRDFLNTPSFQTIKTFQAQKAARLALVNTLSGLIDSTMRPGAGVPAAAAEENPETGIAASGESENSENAENSEIIENYENIIAELKKRNGTLEKTVADQEKNSRNANTANTATANDLRSQNRSLQQSLELRENALTELRNQNTALQQNLTAAQQNLTARESAATELRTQISTLQRTVTERDTSMNTLKTQNGTLQQAVTERDASINTLKTQNSSLQRTTDQLRVQNDTFRAAIEQLNKNIDG